MEWAEGTATVQGFWLRGGAKPFPGISGVGGMGGAWWQRGTRANAGPWVLAPSCTLPPAAGEGVQGVFVGGVCARAGEDGSFNWVGRGRSLGNPCCGRAQIFP